MRLKKYLLKELELVKSGTTSVSGWLPLYIATLVLLE